jgi:hypothetical protein
MATQPSDWTFNGSATYDATAQTGVLTPAVNSQTGTIIYQNAIVTDSFVVRFDFRISTRGADGMGFMIEKAGNSVVGGGGDGLGMVGLDGYGVELDDYDNGLCSDFNDNHTAVDRLTACDVSGQPAALASSANLNAVYGYDIADGQWRTCTIHVANGAVSVTIDQDGSSNRAALSNVRLTGFTTGDLYYFGFSGATGAFSQTQEIRNVTITFPTPRCL